jgi:hypothetical protein
MNHPTYYLAPGLFVAALGFFGLRATDWSNPQNAPPVSLEYCFSGLEPPTPRRVYLKRWWNKKLADCGTTSPPWRMKWNTLTICSLAEPLHAYPKCG